VRRSPGRDLLVGCFVLAGILAVAWLSIRVGGLSYAGPRGFMVLADFDELGGLKERAPVVISGVKVGQVDRVALTPEYRARVTMDLDPSLKLPDDTTASIVTAGLLGDRYISLQLGGDDKLLQNGDRLSFTESAVLLERLLGKFVHDTDVGKAKDQ
jgi:phospholipid/cholesterol/gamma-HCH transport system substrate-binding protein